MYQSQPDMTIGILFIALLGMLFLSALVAMVVGLVLVTTKAGRVILGAGVAVFLGLVILAGGFLVVGYSRTEVIPPLATEMAVESNIKLHPPVAPTGEIPLEAKPAAAAPKPNEPEEIKPEVEQIPPEAPQTSTSAPARTLSAFPDYPFSEYPFSDMRPPHFSDDFGPFGSRGQRYASSAGSDPHAEIQRLREQAMSGLYERLHGNPVSNSSKKAPVEEEPVASNEADSEPNRELPSIIPPGRPNWVEQAPVWEDDGTCFVAVSSGPFDRGMDCRKVLENETRIALREFANDYLDHPYAAEMLGSKLDALQDTVVVETYREELTPSIGPMQQWHSLLKFDSTLQQKLREMWQAQQQVSRIVYIGVGFFGLLGILTIFYLGMSLTGEGSKLSPWLVSAGTVVALGGLFVVGVIFVRTFPML